MSFLNEVSEWSLSPGIWICELENRDDGLQTYFKEHTLDKCHYQLFS